MRAFAFSPRVKLSTRRKETDMRRWGGGKVKECAQSFFGVIRSVFGSEAFRSFLPGCCFTHRLGGVMDDGQAALTEWELEAIRYL